MTKFQVFRLHQENNELVGPIEDMSVDDLDEADVLIKYSSFSCKLQECIGWNQGGRQDSSEFSCIAGVDVSGTVVESQGKRFKEGD